MGPGLLVPGKPESPSLHAPPLHSPSPKATPPSSKIKIKANEPRNPLKPKPPTPPVALKSKTGPKLKDFRDYLAANKVPEIEALRGEVEAFAKAFPTIGFEKGSMRYTQ